MSEAKPYIPQFSYKKLDKISKSKLLVRNDKTITYNILRIILNLN